jgi:hypothetical protein
MQPPFPLATRIDHLVVAAPDLDAGAAWVRAVLGAECRPGGRHERMGTHNRLLRLGDDLYVEVIAVDPAARPPGRPRWFSLDTFAPDAMPRLVGWVARTTNIYKAASASPEPLGTIEQMSRGDLSWRLTIPPDGSLPLGGAAPLLIQWDTSHHPATRLPDDGFTLVRLDVTHPEPDRVWRLLTAVGFDGPVGIHSGDRALLAAEIGTQSGVRRLVSVAAGPSESAKVL